MAVSTGTWLVMSIFFALVGLIARNRFSRSALMVVSGGVMLLGIIASIGLVVYAASRHGRRDGSDILFIVAVFPAILSMFAWIVFILAKKTDTASSEPEAIIPKLAGADPQRLREHRDVGPRQGGTTG